MIVVHVSIQVKPECVEDFKAASEANARASIQEPGIAQFDVVQQADDPCRFVLIEVYRQPEAPARHKETPHYARWRDTVAPMMAVPRSSVKYQNVCPGDADWDRRRWGRKDS
jgi:(4S)-4-hydroxy-5-phosphonooxypentane-2,3-dione isomerase